MFSDDQKALLRSKLDPKHVKKPSGQFGPKGDYIEGWHAIDEANRIFGFDGWSYRIVDMTECHQPTKNEKGNFGVSFVARVEVSAGGITREDVGYGSGFSRLIGDAYESAVKEAVTDALKRALRTFGNPFGLALYDKTRANVEAPEAANKPAALSKEKARPIFSTLQDDMRRNKSQADLGRWLKDPDVNELRTQLPDDWNRELRKMAKELYDSLPAETRPEDQPSMMAG